MSSAPPPEPRQLVGLTSYGSYYRNGTRYPGWLSLRLSDGTSRYFRENTPWDEAIATLAAEGIETKTFCQKLDDWTRRGPAAEEES